MRSKEEMKKYWGEYYQKNRDELNRKKRIFCKRPEVKLKISRYNNEYRKKNKDKIKKHNQSTNVKEYYKKYNQRPEVKQRIKEYFKRPEVKLRRSIYVSKNKKERIKICVVCGNSFNPYSNQKTCCINCKEKRIKEIRKEYNNRLDVRERRNKKMREHSKSKEYKRLKRNYQKQRRNNEEGFSMEGKLRTLFYLALQKYSKTGKIMSSKKYSIDYKAIIEHLGPKPEDGNIYEVDHIIPLSLFDHNDLEQIKKAWSPENHQWLTKEINRWKSNRLIEPLDDEEKERLQKQLEGAHNYE